MKFYIFIRQRETFEYIITLNIIWIKHPVNIYITLLIHTILFVVKIKIKHQDNVSKNIYLYRVLKIIENFE